MEGEETDLRGVPRFFRRTPETCSEKPARRRYRLSRIAPRFRPPSSLRGRSRPEFPLIDAPTGDYHDNGYRVIAANLGSSEMKTMTDRLAAAGKLAFRARAGAAPPADPGSTAHGWLALVSIAAALLLSTLSWLGICTEACAEAHLYRLFGVPLPPLGVGFFALCGLALLAGRRSSHAGFALAVLLAGALGSELVFLWIQKYVIGRWCPLCVGVAVSVAAACALVAWEQLRGAAAQIRHGERNIAMKVMASKTLVVLAAFAAGIAVSAVGMKKLDAFAAGFSAKSVVLGNENSGAEVFILTDWYCPACRAAEPEIVKGAAHAMRRARVVFVDYPIHPESLNYIPYNLSFMIREKEKYLRIREALAALAVRTKEPTAEDVQAAVAGLGVKYVPLNYADVLAGTQFFNSVVQRFKVPGTPSVVVLDAQTGKSKTLTGVADITADAIAQALAEVSGK